MKVFLLLSIFVFLLNACSNPNNRSGRTNSELYNTTQSIGTPLELTPEQASAFDAFNTLQTSTDEQNRLYSTFAGTAQPCYTIDTSLSISQSAFRTAMKQFVTSNCKRLSEEEREELAASAALAQEEYTLLLCLGVSANVRYENGAPRTGTWVIPRVLGRRDVVINW